MKCLLVELSTLIVYEYNMIKMQCLFLREQMQLVLYHEKI